MNLCPDKRAKEKVIKTRKLRPAGWAALAAALLLFAIIGYFAALGFFKVEEVEVPNVVNEELEVATEMLEEAGLRVSVLSEIHDVEVPEGHVISQNPEGGQG